MRKQQVSILPSAYTGTLFNASFCPRLPLPARTAQTLSLSLSLLALSESPSRAEKSSGHSLSQRVQMSQDNAHSATQKNEASRCT